MRSEAWRPAAAACNHAPGGREPPAGHYDPDARSFLSGITAGDASAVPPPKIATVERREAGVPRMGRKAPRKAPGLPRYVQAHRCLASTGRLSALRCPSSG
jgi:hypothetical protein